MATDTKITKDKVNSIYSELETIRTKHYNVAGQNAEANAALANAFKTAVAVQDNKIQASDWDLYQTYLTALQKSTWKAADSMYTVSKPAVGDIIKEDKFNTIQSQVDTINDLVIANTSCFSFSNTTNFNCYGFSDTSNFDCFGFSFGFTGNFGCFGFSKTSNFGCFGFSNTTNFGCFGFSNTTNFGCFGFSHTSNFGSFNVSGFCPAFNQTSYCSGGYFCSVRGVF